MAVSRTTNLVWYNAVPGGQDMAAMKSALHRGTIASLNLYSTGLSQDLLGIAWYPWDISDITQDGVGPPLRSQHALLRVSLTLLPLPSNVPSWQCLTNERAGLAGGGAFLHPPRAGLRGLQPGQNVRPVCTSLSATPSSVRVLFAFVLHLV